MISYRFVPISSQKGVLFLRHPVVVTMVVGGVLSTGVSAAQHCCQCWPDVKCETDPSMYLYVFV